MKKKRLLLAALIFGLSSWANAGVPVIKVHESGVAEETSYSLHALTSDFFGIKGNGKATETGTRKGMPNLQLTRVADTASGSLPGILTPVSVLTGHRLSAGSFSFYAREEASFSPSSYRAADFDRGSRGAALRDGAMVASPPALKSWAVLLLILACLIYQGRQGIRRARPFAFKKLN